MVIYDAEFGAYMCEICMLHYNDKNLAKRCEDWDRTHNSCNLAIAGKSIEAASRRTALKV
ncbi:MAG: hypothetical protein M1125_01285 [Candidatus Marsarchaeota archaeon]|nr:hypothetical protein [Candidatus Marsarchaeota archaeon]